MHLILTLLLDFLLVIIPLVRFGHQARGFLCDSNDTMGLEQGFSAGKYSFQGIDGTTAEANSFCFGFSV